MKPVDIFQFVMKRGDSWLSTIGRMIGILCTVSIILTLSAGVISRYVFNQPFFWTDEFARILLIWSIFIGAAMGFRKGTSTAHIGMDYFVSLLPQKAKKVAVRFGWLVNMLFCVLILMIGTIFFIQTISFRTAALDISKGFIYVCLPIFGIMTLVFLINQFLDR
ncbi:MAG: TRAP transporter small permease [Deltaproteobacteria bacterium]|nr:MAG: TRAP transporter small permease [Deltaproteobacteria bacterium]